MKYESVADYGIGPARKLSEHYGLSLEWLRRTCTRCGYTWNERPLDAGA